ncbi:cl- channel CLC-3 and related proteins [Moesziomyces antarcticus T-34]|uniref:Chloride channel protein n=1 Tax=Pseudozyma antarctica (strain T-34) TaxID=1151754 RepID=M9MC09_PSEA3|nr:cl- channel CLC-3 and related proteins [Moesziomyces antarcticus T-34]
MSVLLETSVGDIVIDLHTEAAPRSCTNFLKLCSKHFYKLNAFFRVEKDFLAQTGDPTNTGKGGASIWSQLPSTSRDRLDSSLFQPDTDETLKHTSKGTVSFACIRSQEHAEDEGVALLAGSQFFITLKDDIEYLDGKHVPFGTVVEGQEAGGTLDKINAAFTDDQKRPLKDIRIRHVVVLEDPFPDPDGFSPPSRSPSPTPSQLHALRLADDEDLSEERDETEKEQQRRDADTNAAALTLEMVGDLPFAEIRPPENILFVCKLNPVTRSEDLELIFSRFGRIMSCEVIKDKKTGDSLQYAFIEFDKKDDAERAYFKMQNVLVDDRRIWVDFSQSVSRLHGDWVKKRNGGREAPRGHYKWGHQSSRNGSHAASRTSSHRPRDQGGRAESSEHSRPQRQDWDRQDRSQRARSPRRDESRERDHKRSRRQDDGDDRRYRRIAQSVPNANATVTAVVMMVEIEKASALAAVAADAIAATTKIGATTTNVRGTGAILVVASASLIASLLAHCSIRHTPIAWLSTCHPRRARAGQGDAMVADMSASPYTRSSALAPSPTAAYFPSSSRRSSVYTSNAAAEDDEALDEIRRYESFSTVDWVVDSTRERNRIARERNAASAHFSNAQLANGSRADAAWGHVGFGRAGIPPRWWSRGPWGRRAWLVWGIVKSALAAFTDSGVIVLVGILIGLNMGVISLATEWASDLKQGYCSSGWWLNQKFCCWEMMDPAGPGGAPLPAAAKALATATVTVTAPAASLDPTGSTTLLSTAAPAAARATARAIAHEAYNLTLGAVRDHELWSRAAQDIFHDGLGAGLGLMARAEGAPSPGAGDLSETCTDWVPWSRWAFPAWIVYMLFASLLSFVCAHLVKSFAPYAAGSGISEIKCILAGFVINGYLGFWTLAIKSLTLPLAIASGLSVGKEGPAVHVACCIGNVVASFFRSFNRSQAKMRELLTAASAAGVAVAFGSPIGGVLFSLEEMAYNFPASTMWRSFLCALAATVTLSFMNPFRTGKLVLFQVSYDRDWHYFEIIFYMIIGVFGGLYGAFVIKYNLQVQSFRRSYLAKHGVSEVVVLAVLTAFIGYANKFLRIDMTESLEILFRECEGGGDYDNLCQSWAQWRMVNSLLLATVLRTALVIISYGCKVPAGIFVPSMAIGATFGRMVGILVKALYNAFPHWSLFSACQPDVPCITPGTYAFLGAAAALAGVTRITVAVVVIMFELTGALTYILPTMIVVGITKGVADWFSRGGIAEQMIKFSGYPFLDKDDHSFGVPVADVMRADPQVLYAAGMRLGELETKLADATYKGLPLVQSREDATLLGYAGKTELRYAVGKARRARTLDADTTCLFSVGPNRAHGSRRGTQQQDLLNVASLPTTAAADQALREDMLSRFSGAAAAGGALGLGGSGATAARASQRQHESESLIGQLDGAHDDDDDAPRARSNYPSAGADSDGDEMDEDAELGEAGGGVDGEGDSDVLELAGWIDPTPLIVQPDMALETVMDMFKNLGPRVILVVEYGKLSGLVTVKDVLKRIAQQEKAEAAARSASLPTTAAGAHEGIGGGELEVLLKEAYDWAQQQWASIAPHFDRLGARMGVSTRTASRASAYSHLGSHAGRYDSTPEPESESVPLHSSQGGQRHKPQEDQHSFVLGEADE